MILVLILGWAVLYTPTVRPSTPCSRSSRRRHRDFVRTGGGPLPARTFSCASCRRSRAGWRPTAVGARRVLISMFALSGSASSASVSSETRTRCSPLLGAPRTRRGSLLSVLLRDDARHRSAGKTRNQLRLHRNGNGARYSRGYGGERAALRVLRSLPSAVPCARRADDSDALRIRFLRHQEYRGIPSLSVYKHRARRNHLEDQHGDVLLALRLLGRRDMGTDVPSGGAGVFALRIRAVHRAHRALRAPEEACSGEAADRPSARKIAALVLPASGVALFLLTRVQGEPLIVSTLLLFGIFSNTAFSPVAVAPDQAHRRQRHPGSSGAAVGFSTRRSCPRR